MTPPKGREILRERPRLDFVVDSLADRPSRMPRWTQPMPASCANESERALDLLDEWSNTRRN